MAALTLSLLGPPQITRADGTAVLRARKELALPFSRNGLGLTTGLRVGAIVSMVIAVQTTSGGNSQRRVPAVDSSL